MATGFGFTLQATDGKARTGVIHTPRGEQTLCGPLDRIPGDICFHGLTVYRGHAK